MIAQAIRIKNPYDFEKVVALYFQRQGYEFTFPPANIKGYDIELRKDSECIAVQVKNHKAKVRTAQVIKMASSVLKLLQLAESKIHYKELQ